MSEDNSIVKCPECGTKLQATCLTCPECQTPITTPGLLCPNSDCRYPIRKEWKICPDCGTTLSGWKTPPITETPGDSSVSRPFISMGGPISATHLDLSPGKILAGRYRVVKELGKGGFGVVYHVEDSVLDEPMALKIVVAGEGEAGDAVKPIIHEFKLRSKINDFRHIINAQDPRPCPYKELSLVLLPMQLAGGGSLRQWLSQNQDVKKRLKTGIKLFRQACLGVQAIHKADLVHLDIKPENILIVDGEAKISDFGIGRYGSKLFEKNPEQLLHRGVGTPRYMSPEQFRVARPIDIKKTSDIYSLGIVLFEILDGRRPFDGSPLELQDAHLNLTPPPLTGESEKWWLIVEQCLQKKATDRYPNIERLLKDLDRVAEGLAISVDVSCRNPNCGHTNVIPYMVNVKRCEKCGDDLPDSFFRLCPSCGKILRCDIEICPYCDENVVAHYQLLEQKEQVEKLKDENPVEAIGLLRKVLKHLKQKGDTIEYRERAITLLNELEEKQSHLPPLIAKAQVAETARLPKEAVEVWREVLKIIPRHGVATERVRKLESSMKNFRKGWKKAITLMDEAKFQDADKLLQDCVEFDSTRDDINKLLDTCRERASKYNRAFDEASTAVRDKLIQKANEEIDEALSQAPNSEEALTLKRNIQKILQEIKPLVPQVRNQLVCAEFSEVDKGVAKIEEQQIDDSEVLSLKKNLAKTRESYTQLIENTQSAMESHDLIKALEFINKAIELCPESSIVQNLLEQVKNGQKNASELIDEALLTITAAKFEEAETLLKQAGELWSTGDSLEDSREKLKKTQTKFNGHMKQARESKTDKDLEKAQEEADFALMICPASEETKCLLRDVIKEKADNLMETAKFEEVEVLLKQAKKLWPTVGGFNEVEDTLTKTCTEYKKYMRRARWAKTWRRLGKASKAVKQAEKICPRSQDVANLKNDIGIATPKWEEKKKRARNRTAKIAKRIIFLIPAIIGVILFLYSQFELGGIAVLISALAIFFKKEGHKKMYKAVMYCRSSIANRRTKVCEKTLTVKEKSQATLQETKPLTQKIRSDQEKAHNLIDKATVEINAAKFNEAEALLGQVEEFWSTMEELENSREKLEKTRIKYNRYMEQASQAKTDKNLEKAQEKADLALIICSASEDAKSLLRDVIKEKAHNLMITAEFEKADVLLKQAKELWPTIGDLDDVKDILTKTRTEYNKCMKRAERAKAWRRLGRASKAVEQAEKICPRSHDVANLKNDIGAFRK